MPENFYRDNPLIKISKIVLGKNCGLERTEHEFLEKIKHNFSFTFGYDILVELQN